MSAILSIVVLLVFVTTAWTQDLQKSAPKTKLEAFTGATGAVLLKGYTEMGSVKGAGSANMTAMTFRNAATGKETSGIIIEIRGSGSSYANAPRSYIDYDEISGLLDGIDYITKTDSTVTKLKNFEAIYSTKGDLRITVFNNSAGKLSAAIQSGRYSSQNAFITLNQLKEFRALIVKAKHVIDVSKEQKQEVNPPGKPLESHTNSQPASKSPISLFAPSPAGSWK
jgi:hypothetical protein